MGSPILIESCLNFIDGSGKVFPSNFISLGTSAQAAEDNRLCLSKGRTNNEYKRLCETKFKVLQNQILILILMFIPSSVSTHFLSEAVTTAVGEVAEAGEDEFDLGPNRILHVQTQNLAGCCSSCF